jgi:hypothetical protein
MELSRARLRFFIRRIYVLGGGKWLCALVVRAPAPPPATLLNRRRQALLACTHFTIGLAFCISALLDNRIAAVSAPRSNGLVSVALVFGTVTDVGIAALMCWRLLASRTGWGRTDTVLRTLITYTINSGVLTALCVLGGLAASVAAKGTQFELFFLLILPERASLPWHRATCGALTPGCAVYVNSYLGSLNAREVLLSQGDHSDDKWSVSGCGRALAMSVRGAGGADSGAHGGRPPVIRVERSTVRHTDSGLPDGKDELDGARGASLPDFDLERAETKVRGRAAGGARRADDAARAQEDHSLSYAGQ